jgi:hypothetical protein
MTSLVAPADLGISELVSSSEALQAKVPKHWIYTAPGGGKFPCDISMIKINSDYMKRRGV